MNAKRNLSITAILIAMIVIVLIALVVVSSQLIGRQSLIGSTSTGATLVVQSINSAVPQPAATVTIQSTNSVSNVITTDTAAPSISSNQSRVLFYSDQNKLYTYKLGDAAPTQLTIMSTLSSYFTPQGTTQWSDINHAFLTLVYNGNNSPPDGGPGGVLYRISENQVNAEPVSLGDATNQVFPDDAQWSPEGKMIALSLGQHSPSGDPPTYNYLAVYTPGEKLRIIVGPGIVDANGQPTLTITTDMQESTLSPRWSPDRKYLAFRFVRKSLLDGKIMDSNEHFLSTDCLLKAEIPCKIQTLNTPSQQGWGSFSWLPDSKHMIFVCISPILGLSTDDPHFGETKEDLCTVALAGSEFKHLGIPDLIPQNFNVVYALSPNGNTLAYTQPTSSIYIFDMVTGKVINTSPTDSSQIINFMAWLPAQSADALAQLPTFTAPPPSSTPSLKLSLKSVCIPAGENSGHKDFWQWEVINPNPVVVRYTFSWHNLARQASTKVGVAPAAINGIPGNDNTDTLTEPGSSYKVDLYVSGVLQDEESIPAIACTGATLKPSRSPVPTRTITPTKTGS